MHTLRTGLLLVGLLIGWVLPAEATFIKNTVTNAANLTDGQLLVGDLGAHGVKTFAACTDGLIITWSGGAIVCGSISAANPALSNLASVAVNLSLIPGAAGTLDLGSATLPWEFLYLSGTSGTPGTNNFKFVGAATAARTITIPDATDTLVGKATVDSFTNKTINCSATGMVCSNFPGGASALSAITAATGANTIASGDNAQVWDWTLTTAAKSAFKINETAAATNGAGSQFLLDVGTLATSTASPFIVRALGTEVFRVPAGGATINAADGSAGVPMYSFTSGTGYGMWRAANTLGFSVAGTQVMALTTFAGNFGVQLVPGTKTAVALTDSANGNAGFYWPSSNHVGVVGHLTSTMTTAPTVTGTCGSSPSVAGTDHAMLITVGTGGTAVDCTITFNVAFVTNNPVCNANSDTTADAALAVVTTLTTVKVTKASALTASSHIHVRCQGWLN